jgi:RNA polymerase sigma-70 factor (ECF subfamily)
MRSPRAAVPAPAGGGNLEEADLVQRCLEGDATAWDTLVKIYWKPVFNIAYKFVAQFDEAEDLTQEIFVKLFRALPSFDRRASFETWLTRVSRNLCIDHYRRRRREERRFTDEVDLDTIQFDELLSRPDATLEQRDQVAMVRRALAKLPPMYREAVALRDVHDLSYEEITQRLQLPEGTIKSRINRGRKELARHLRIQNGRLAVSTAERRRSRDRREASHAED